MENMAIANASRGVSGKKGTLNGRSAFGSFLLKAKSESIDIMYRINAAKTEIVIMTLAFPVNTAMIP